MTERFLDVVVRHLADIPQDGFLTRAVQQQRVVVEAYPASASAAAFAVLAKQIEMLPSTTTPSGGIEFFFEHLLRTQASPRGMVA